MFTCSAGDSCFSIDSNCNLIPCHRLFYFNDSQYIKVAEKSGNENVIVKDIHKTNNVNDNYCVKIDSKEQILRMLYILRGFNDFYMLRHNYQTAMIKLMAQNGQVSRCYMNNDLAELLSILTCIGMMCTIENILHGGSSHITLSPLFKLFGNGLCERIIKRIIKEN